MMVMMQRKANAKSNTLSPKKSGRLSRGFAGRSNTVVGTPNTGSINPQTPVSIDNVMNAKMMMKNKVESMRQKKEKPMDNRPVSTGGIDNKKTTKKKPEEMSQKKAKAEEMHQKKERPGTERPKTPVPMGGIENAKMKKNTVEMRHKGGKTGTGEDKQNTDKKHVSMDKQNTDKKHVSMDKQNTDKKHVSMGGIVNAKTMMKKKTEEMRQKNRKPDTGENRPDTGKRPDTAKDMTRNKTKEVPHSEDHGSHGQSHRKSGHHHKSSAKASGHRIHEHGSHHKPKKTVSHSGKRHSAHPKSGHHHESNRHSDHPASNRQDIPDDKPTPQKGSAKVSGHRIHEHGSHHKPKKTVSHSGKRHSAHPKSGHHHGGNKHTDYPASNIQEFHCTDIPDDNQAPQKGPNLVLKELVDTEQTYVSQLEDLMKFKQQASTILKHDVIIQMLPDIESIHKLHKENLLPPLKDRISKWKSGSTVVDILLKITPFFKIYQNYMVNNKEAQNTFIKLKKTNKAFAKLTKDLLSKGINIESRMITPIQRLPRYELLLKEYKKHVPENSPERKDIQKIQDQLFKTCMNHEATERDVLAKLYVALDGKFEIYSTSRVFIASKSNVIVRKKQDSDKLLSGCEIYLFNDIVLITQEKSSSKKTTLLHLFQRDCMKVTPTRWSGLQQALCIADFKVMVDVGFREQKVCDQWSQLLKQEHKMDGKYRENCHSVALSSPKSKK